MLTKAPMTRPSPAGLAVRFGAAFAFLGVAAFVAHAQAPTDEGPPPDTGVVLFTGGEGGGGSGGGGGGPTGHTGSDGTGDTGNTDTDEPTDTGEPPPPPDPDPPSSVPLPGGGTLNLELDAVTPTAPETALVEATLFLDADAVPTRPWCSRSTSRGRR